MSRTRFSVLDPEYDGLDIEEDVLDVVEDDVAKVLDFEVLNIEDNVIGP